MSEQQNDSIFRSLAVATHSQRTVDNNHARLNVSSRLLVTSHNLVICNLLDVTSLTSSTQERSTDKGRSIDARFEFDCEVTVRESLDIANDKWFHIINLKVPSFVST
jgi:hypothetical protein